MDITKELQDRVNKLFEEKKITCMVGYEHGSLPYKNRPCFITVKEDINRLIFDSFCVNNLSIYLSKYAGEKIAVAAHPCTLRSIVSLAQNNQIKLENIHIIGINCPGMIDPNKIQGLAFLKIKSIEDKDDKIIINTSSGPVEYKKANILYDKCTTCNHEMPSIYNDLIGEKKVNTDEEIDEYKFIREFEKLPQEKRWEFWEKEFSKCIRCYACRNVCPICYCKECIVEKTMPQWISKLNKSSTNEYYNLIRVIHVMGRCTDCGECERVCPVKIPYRKLIKKMEKEIKELYGYKPGMNPCDAPPLATFKENDPEEGIK